MPWLSITLDLDGAEAEAMSEALLEAGALSVEMADPHAGTKEEQAWFDEPGAPPRPWRRMRLVALADAAANAEALVEGAARACSIALPAFRAGRVENEDWIRRTQAQFEPLRCGERLWVVPSWRTPPDPAALNLRLDPGVAFGTGSHESTRLVLGWLERAIRGGERALDYGCGSGILALAAALLGAREVAAVDLDPQALEATAANARANGVALSIAAPHELPDGTYDIVVANILAQPLIDLEPTLAARTAAGGRLALSGVLASQAPEVIAAYAPRFAAKVAAEEEGWVLIVGKRTGFGS
jgi:ribosomal protein L11 methyltransferase